MVKIETKLKKQGWQIEKFQPKGEAFPWSLKIQKKLKEKKQSKQNKLYFAIFIAELERRPHVKTKQNICRKAFLAL